MKQIDVKTFVREWVKDLRSGKFAQTTERLCKIDDGSPQYCCLGVACVTGKRLGLTKKAFLSKDHYAYGTPDFDWFTNLFDYKSDPRLVLLNGVKTTCTDANDKLQMNFNEIADALERTYLT